MVLTKNSKKPSIPTTPKKWAMNAIVEPNFGNLGSNIRPRNKDTRNSTNKMAAFQTIGPREMTAMRISGLGGNLPLGSGNDFTNI